MNENIFKCINEKIFYDLGKDFSEIIKGKVRTYIQKSDSKWTITYNGEGKMGRLTLFHIELNYVNGLLVKINDFLLHEQEKNLSNNLINVFFNKMQTNQFQKTIFATKNYDITQLYSEFNLKV